MNAIEYICNKRKEFEYEWIDYGEYTNYNKPYLQIYSTYSYRNTYTRKATIYEYIDGSLLYTNSENEFKYLGTFDTSDQAKEFYKNYES